MKKKEYITPAITTHKEFSAKYAFCDNFSNWTDEAFAKQFDFSGIDFDETEDKEWSMWTYQPFEDFAEDNSKTY